MPNANHKILIIDDDKVTSTALEGLLSSRTPSSATLHFEARLAVFQIRIDL